MNKTIACICLILSIFSSMPVASKQQLDEIPLRDFFKNPERDAFEISASGKYIAYLKPWKSRMNIFIQEISKDRVPSGKEKQVTFVQDRDIRTYTWKGDNYIVYYKDFAGDENFHVFAVELNKITEQDLTPFKNVRAMIVDDLDQISDTDMLIQTNQRNPEVFDVYRVNIRTGAMQMVAENSGKIDSWLTDHAGVVRVASENDGLKTIIYTRASERDDFKKILEFNYESDFSPLLFTADNAHLYASSNLNRDKSAIVLVDPKSGKELKSIFKHPEVDVTTLGYSKKRKTITAASYVTWKRDYKFFDKIAEARYKSIKKQVGDSQIYIASGNQEEDLFSVFVTDDKTAGRYYLYDQNTDKLSLLADTAPWLPAEKLASMRPIKYKSRDGLLINGYLTIPLASSGKNLPVIVNPHGGPWARDRWGYNPEVQFLASRGYAVFQMNFRGSTGYGKEFFKKSFKQWGRAMQNDITDGVQWLIKQGIADPKKIGIYGGSYGGYATLAGITFTPNLYAAAVDYVGVSNLFTFMDTIPAYWRPGLAKLHAMVGDPAKDKDAMAAASPAFHTDKIVTPLFVAQGAKDPRVNINESNQIVNSLRKRGVEVQYMVKQNEGHGFHNEENRFEFYAAMEKFFHRHLLN